jgi:hypothetical protein
MNCKYCIVRLLYYESLSDNENKEKRMKEFRCPYEKECKKND